MSRYPHTCTIQVRAKKQKLSYTGGTGTPTIGQTVTGGTSHKTAVIDKVASGYLVVKTVSGAFTVGETLTTATFSGTLSAQADYQNQSNEFEYYWTNNQTSVSCRFYYPTTTKSENVPAQGQILSQPLKCAVIPTATLNALEYRIVSTVSGYSGTFNITEARILTYPAGIHHCELILSKTGAT